MSVEHIQEKFIHACDNCGATEETASRVSRPKHWSELVIHRDAYDMHDMAVADGTVRRGFCSKCSAEVATLINEWGEKK